MSKLRKLPSKHQCEQDLGYDDNGDYRGFCADPAVVRCNTCGRYFCEECWEDHLEMSIDTNDAEEGAIQVLDSLAAGKE